MEGRLLELGQTRYGSGVFAKASFSSGSRIVRLGGAIVERAMLPSPYEAFEDRFLQVGPRHYIGPSGDLDDFINHSCSPNTGLVFSANEIWVTAIKEIAVGEEITFDYSTTMDEDDWELECDCGSASCRGRIRDFRKLPDNLRKHYIALGIVPIYLIDELDLRASSDR